MNKSKRKFLSVLAIAIVALFAMACLIGFAACGGDEPCTTHTVTTWDSTTDATCTEAGSRTGVCDVCGETVTETIPALGHSFVSYPDDDEYLAPTCTEAGTDVQICSRCGRIEYPTIAATGHSYDTGVVTKEASDVEDGEMTYTCTVCGDTYTVTIPKTGDDDYEYEEDTGTKTTYRYEFEDAKLYGDESEMVAWLCDDDQVYQGSMIVSMGFIFGVHADSTASGQASVGYLAHNNPTATFEITSDKPYKNLQLTVGAASCDVNAEGISSVYGLMAASVNDYSGASHDILTVNGKSVALSGTLQGADSVISSSGLSMNNWGTLTASIDLKTGLNTIVFTHDDAGVNWDYIEIATSATLTFQKTDNTNFASYDLSEIEEYSLEALPVSMKEW